MGERGRRRHEHQLRCGVARAMSATITILGGALLGAAVALLLVPLTRRELAAAVTRSNDAVDESLPTVVERPAPQVARSDSLALATLVGRSPGLCVGPRRLVVQCAAATASSGRPDSACVLRSETPSPAEDPRLRADLRRHRKRRTHRPVHQRDRTTHAGVAGGSHFARPVLHRQPDEPTVDGLRRCAPVPRLWLRPGLGQPDRPLRSIPLCQSAGARGRRGPHRMPRAPTAGPRCPSVSSWLWGLRWSWSPDADPHQRLGRVR